MNELFYIDELEIEEPIGFADIELSIKRDDQYHGMTFEASTTTLQFYGTAYSYLKNKHESEGIQARVIFKAFLACDQYDYSEILSGRLNFGKYKETCGDICSCSLPVEQDSCAIILLSRKDQKVDVDKQIGVDNNTVLPSYLGIAVETELPAHELFVGIDANVSDEGYNINTGQIDSYVAATFAFRPLYFNKRTDSIATGNIDSGTDAGSAPPEGILQEAISPQLLFEDSINCQVGDFAYSFRLKGIWDSVDAGLLTHSNTFKIRLCKGVWPSGITEEIAEVDIAAVQTLRNYHGVFDQTFSGNTTFLDGEGIYMLLQFEMTGVGNGPGNYINVQFDKESLVTITATKACAATDAELYYVHETLSRVVESITNECIRVKSSFYGRTDSEPFSFPIDGCGGLRSVTSGLKIRRAVEDKFFVSLKDLIEGLNAIDNIGFDVVDDPDIPTASLLRIEGVDFWYEDKEIMRHDGVPKADTEVEETRHYSRVQVGYKKWEVEEVNGLDEFNSNREYSTSIDTVNSSLDITSILIAGTYPIEITREQSFADSGGADTKYDNETFIICMRRMTYPYTNLLGVELGNITDAANIFSPNTIYNYRISPLRNLMRWYKTIAAGFGQLFDAINSLFFSSGTGNLTASGIMTDSICREENSDLQENQNIFVTKFSVTDYIPLWKNELITYEYPMSVADYKTLKADPYGYISVQCGNGDFVKYWVKEIKYKPMKGTATIAGRRKYGA